MGNVNMEASQIHYRGGNRPMSVEDALKAGSEVPTYIPGDGVSIIPEEEGSSINVKLQGGGGLLFDENNQIYVDPAIGYEETYNFNNNTPNLIGKVIKGQNVYPLYRAFAEPTSPLFTPYPGEETSNFMNAGMLPLPLDERAINIKFFAGDIDVTDTFEFGRIGLNGSTYLQTFACHMASRVQITKVMVDYYTTT